MSITGYRQTQTDGVTTVTVITDLSGTIYYHWYLDGWYLGVTTAPQWSFRPEDGDQVRIEVLDTNDAEFDPLASAPSGWPARKTQFWVRSLDADVDFYRVEQKQDAGSWEEVGIVHHAAGRWSYTFLTDRLVDLAQYTWRIVPVDAAGNDGTAITLDQEKVVRTPDGPDFTIAFDEGTTKVTFAEAV